MARRASIDGLGIRFESHSFVGVFGVAAAPTCRDAARGVSSSLSCVSIVCP